MSTRRYVLSLDDIAKDSIPLVGGKAAKLGEMNKEGFRIPDAFVITTNAYAHSIKQGGVQEVISQALAAIDYDQPETVKRASSKITTAIDKLVLDDSILSEINSIYGEMNEARVAVRSSATAEDLAEASFAGQYETFLNIKGTSSLLENIKRCYASLWTPRAISYRHSKGIQHEAVRLAVLVQTMVDAKKAGVLFTDDPTVRSGTQMIIESNFGLGESVVSGVASPDRYVVSRKDNPSHKAHKVLSCEIGTKDIIIQSKESSTGTTSMEISSELGQQSSLTDEEAIALAEIGASLEKLFGGPQDIEWAYDDQGVIHVLQSRPITVFKGETTDDEIIWSRGYSDDYWNDNVTPLFFDLLGQQLKYIVNIELNQIMGYKNMPTDLLKLYKAHVYFNLDVLRTKVVNEIPPFVRNDDLLNYFPEGHGPYGKDTMRNLPFALSNRAMAEIRVMLYDSKGSMSNTDKEYRKWTEETFIPYLDDFDEKLEKLRGTNSLKPLMLLTSELDKVMISHFRLVRYGIPVHNIGMNLIANYLLQRFLGDDAAAKLFPLLVTGLEHKTNETNKRLSKLAETARSLPRVKDIILNNQSSEIHGLLSKRTEIESKQFFSEFNTFLAEFGVRGYTREPYYPRWGEQPSLVFDILKPLVSSEGNIADDVEKSTKERRLKAEKIVEKYVKKVRFGKIKLILFEALLGLSRTYNVFRENQRFNLDRWITRNRALYLEVGRILSGMGIINDPQQVFFFCLPEIRGISNSKYNQEQLSQLSKVILEREQEFKENEDTIPPKFIHGTRFYDDKMDYTDDDTSIRGLAASQGRVEGKVRVLLRIEDISQVQQGEILVVPRTDPGWTPVFAQIGGLITETGGVLSHGAVVSREYGIPAVTNIRQACQKLKTGQLVILDGNTGTVSLHDGE